MAVESVPRAARELLSHLYPEVANRPTPVGKVLKAMEDTAKRCGVSSIPRLVAVTKTHSVDKVLWGHQQGLRHFGENYVQELHSKSRELNKCGEAYKGIKWHFIGRLQKNKIKLLLDVPGLWLVETVSKHCTAKHLNSCWGLRPSTSSSSPLKVMVQVNTSGEESKLGCSPEEMGDLIRYLLEECPHLDFHGLMTVGKFGHSPKLKPNPDFATLVKCKDFATSTFKFAQPLELSMGMSADFEHAIEMGSTSVRVGTALFGPRVE